MDANQVSGIAIAILTPLAPYLKKVGEAVASEVGKTVFAKGKAIYDTIRKKIEQDNDKPVQQALEALDKNPALSQPLLLKRIAEMAESDVAFAGALSAQVEDLRVYLLECLKERFSTQELKEIYFRLGIDWNEFVGDTAGRSEKMMALIEHVNRKGNMPDLIAAMWQVYPGLNC